MLRCLCGDELIDLCFDTVYVLSGGSSSKPTESISKEGSRLLLWQLGVCCWLDHSHLIADAMVILAELYIFLMLESSSWSVEIS